MADTINVTLVNEFWWAPEVVEFEPQDASTWYLPDEGVYCPNPRMCMLGLNEGLLPGQTCENIPIVILRNVQNEKYYFVAFDEEYLYDRGREFFHIWDNGDETFKFYAFTGGEIHLSYAAVDELFGDQPTFEEVTNLLQPVTYSHVVANGTEYMRIGTEGKISFTVNNSVESTDWYVVWSSEWFRDKGFYEYFPDYNRYPEFELDCIFLSDFVDDYEEQEGYTFKGWSMNGELIDQTTCVNSDVTLTAVWEPPATVDYTINYFTEYGTAPTSKTVTVLEGESYTLTEDDLPKLEVLGYTFTGWYYDEKGENIAQLSDIISQSINLYAVCEKLPDYTIMPTVDYQAACVAIRANTDKTDMIKSADMATAIENIASFKFDSVIDRTITEFTSNVTEVGDYTFYYWNKLKNAELRFASNIGEKAFYNCTSLETIDLPLAKIIETRAFQYCYSLKSVKFPLVTGIGEAAFYYCTSLVTVDLPIMKKFNVATFFGCSALTSLVLRGNFCTLAALNALDGTQISNKKGYIYVPSALVDSYKSATNWSELANQFRALEDYTVDGTTTGELDPDKIGGVTSG